MSQTKTFRTPLRMPMHAVLLERVPGGRLASASAAMQVNSRGQQLWCVFRARFADHADSCHRLDALRKIGPEITTLDIRFQVLCSRSIIRDHAPAIVKWILERKDRNSYDFVVTIDCVALPPRPKYSLRKKGARVARIIVLAEVPGIAHDFYKTPHTLVACPGVPLRWPLDGYVPTDDGWMNPAGDWRSDAWAD